MDPSLQHLLNAIRSAGDRAPSDLNAFIKSCPEPKHLPAPWMTWALIGLVRHQERQQWVADIVRNRLQGDAGKIATIGSFAHPQDLPQRGPVPGMPEWEYYFHGKGCRLSHKVHGEVIDVDFWDESADYFDTFFYEKYLRSLSNLEPPERRLCELHPSVGTIRIAIDDLISIGALTPPPDRDSHPFRLSDDVLSFKDEIDAFCLVWEDPTRRTFLAAAIGDWLAVEHITKCDDVVDSLVESRANTCRELWQQRLRLLLNENFKGGDALQALADMRAPSLETDLVDVLKGTPTGKISAALKIIGELDDPRWCDDVYSLFLRLNPSASIPVPHIWITSLKFLLRHNYKRDEVLPHLSKAGGTEVGEAVLLALENAPRYVLPLVRKGLLADVPICRTEVAAILALINAPWSKRELFRALETSNEQDKTADARAALLELGDEFAEQAVLEWEQRNPHENEMGSYVEVGGRKVGPFYSFGELSLKNRSARISYEMQHLHDRVMPLRKVTPPEEQDDHTR